jgi:hypothetical protein
MNHNSAPLAMCLIAWTGDKFGPLAKVARTPVAEGKKSSHA